MKRGNKSLKSINKFYHEIDSKGSFILYEHNLDGDEYAHILVDMLGNCYTYTWEPIDYTLNNPEEYTWFKLGLIY